MVTRIKRIGMVAAAVFTAFFLVASLGSCSLIADDPDSGKDGSTSLVGYWKSTYGDGFELVDAGGTLTFTQYDDAEKGVSFAGTVVNVPDLTASEGYLTILVTDAGSWYKTEGAYYLARWEGLSGDIVRESTPYSTAVGADNDGLPSAAEAEAEYTEENGYFGYFGEYARQ